MGTFDDQDPEAELDVLPHLATDLLDHLDVLHPKLQPALGDTYEAIMWAAAKRELVEYLLVLRQRHEENAYL